MGHSLCGLLFSIRSGFTDPFHPVGESLQVGAPDCRPRVSGSIPHVDGYQHNCRCSGLPLPGHLFPRDGKVPFLLKICLPHVREAARSIIPSPCHLGGKILIHPEIAWIFRLIVLHRSASSVFVRAAPFFFLRSLLTGPCILMFRPFFRAACRRACSHNTTNKVLRRSMRICNFAPL